jgi:hypothetical protein
MRVIIKKGNFQTLKVLGAGEHVLLEERPIPHHLGVRENLQDLVSQNQLLSCIEEEFKTPGRTIC